MIIPKLFDIVETLYSIENENIPAGSRGTIVHQHTDEAYEVEFINDDGETVALLPLQRNQFVVVWQVETEQDVYIAEQVAQVVALLPQHAGNEVLDFARFLTARQAQKTDSVASLAG